MSHTLVAPETFACDAAKVKVSVYSDEFEGIDRFFMKGVSCRIADLALGRLVNRVAAACSRAVVTAVSVVFTIYAACTEQ